MSVFPRIGILSVLLLLTSASLGGCITSNASSSLMDARAEAPKPPASRTYMAVEDIPSDRKAPLTVDEQSMLKNEMTALRDRQRAAAKAQN